MPSTNSTSTGDPRRVTASDLDQLISEALDGVDCADSAAVELAIANVRDSLPPALQDQFTARARATAANRAEDAGETLRPGSKLLAQAVDLSDLLRDGVPPPTYLPSPTLGERLFYEGQTFLFSGHKKAGKSWAMTLLALDCIKAGRPVVYIDNENGRELFAERLLLLGVTVDDAARFLTYVPFPKDLAKPNELRAEFASIAEALPGAFIVLDSLRTFMARFALNPNHDVDIEQFCGPIMAAIKTAPEGQRPTVGIIDHANRKGTKDDEFVAAGSFAKPAAVDGAYFFTKREPFSQDVQGTVQITVRDDRRGRLDFDRFYRVGGQGEGQPFRIAQISADDAGTGGRILGDIELLLGDNAGKPFTKSAVRDAVKGDNGAIDAALERLAASPLSQVVAVSEGNRPPRYVWDDAAQGGGLEL